MAPRVAVVGSVNLDLVARCERLPSPGETVHAAAFERVPGGKGANQAVAAARLGAGVRMIGCVGADGFAEEALRGLVEAGIVLDIRRADAPTGVALIVVDARGETQITVVPGANAALGPEDVSIEEGEAVLCQYEAIDKRRARLVALTLGAAGAVLLRRGREVVRARPPRVEVVDGTAAGDAFTACLLVSLLERRPPEEALTRACAAGALAASRPGAQPSLPTGAEVDAVTAR